MAKTSRDAYKHIREWSEFFSDLKWLSETLVDEFIKKHRQKQYLKQSLKRLIKRGFVEKQKNKFSLTLEGLLFFKHKGIRRLPKDIKHKWDGRWRLISFDVPGEYNQKRDELRSILKEFDFYPLHKSVWICPNFLAKNFWELIVKRGLDKYCKAMIVEIIEGEEEAKKYFKLK